MAPRASSASEARDDRGAPAPAGGSASSAGSATTAGRSRSTRRRVLDAAAELLATDGLDVSMEAIAERAGVTRMTVYRQLGTREQLLVAVLLDQSNAVVDDLRRLLADEARAFPDRVVDAIVVIVLAVRSSPVLSFFVHGVTPSEFDRADTEDRFLAAVWTLLLPYFEAAEARGELRNPASATLDWTLRQILLQLMVRGTTTEDEAGLRGELDRFFRPSIAPTA